MNRHPSWKYAAGQFGIPLLLIAGLAGCISKKDPSTDPTTPAATVTLVANPTTLAQGESVTLVWASTDATDCTASGGWSGPRALFGDELQTPSATGPVTYTLRCDGVGGSGTATATVTVNAPAPPTVALAAAPDAITLGAASTLTWTSTGASACTASGGWTGSRATDGSEAVTPAVLGATTYTLSCTGPGGTASAVASVTASAGEPVPVATGSLRGRVFNAVDGTPIVGGTVRAGGIEARTDSNGAFAIAAVPVSERRSVEVLADGFEPSYRIVAVADGQEAMVSVQAMPVGVTMMVDPAAGADVQIPGSSAMARFPAGAIAGSVPVAVTVTDLQPAMSADNMPGDYTSIVAGSERLIESFGALSVRLTDPAGGTSINLRPGSTATLRIPVSSLNPSPAPTIPLWFYDTAAGRWVQEGEATLVVAGANRYYEGQVAHFTTWNADSLYESVDVTGCVTDRGLPVAGVSIKSTGINYTGTSTAVSRADGSFTIRVRPNSQLSLAGTLGNLVTSTRALSTGSGPLDLTGNCLQLLRDSVPFSVRLTWGATPLDLDARIILPEGGQVSYQNRGSLVSEPFVNLDTDDQSSFGPEVVTAIRPKVGTYRYFVNNFSRTPSPGITPSPTRVELTANGMLQLFTPPAGETASTFNWTVFDIVIAADCTATLLPASQPWTAAFPVPPSAPNSTAPFCAR